jgi:Holliday junction resolvase RusA-like endonuclease
VPLAGPLYERIKLCYPLVAGKNNGDPYDETPDYDNSIKVLNDILRGLGYYDDDAQNFDGHVSQYYSSPPGIFVKLWEYGGDGS